MSSASRGRGKKRNINWAAVEHIGDDADAGGFLGDEDAERERAQAREPLAVVPPPSPEPQPDPSPEAPVAVSAPPADPPAPDVAEPLPAGKPADTTDDSGPSTLVEAPAEESPEPKAKASSSKASSSKASKRGDRTSTAGKRRSADQPRSNDGPGFTAVSGEPPILRARPRSEVVKLPPAQEQVVVSYNTARKDRNWKIWSGRITPDVIERLKDRAEEDAESSARGRLKPGHYLDAAMRMLPPDAEEQVELADDWLMGKWRGEHPSGETAQFSVSPGTYDFLMNLNKSLRDYRHGIVIDVVSAACDILLDMLADEGLMEG